MNGSKISDTKTMDTLPTKEVNALMSMEEEIEKENLLLCGEDTITTIRSGTSNMLIQMPRLTTDSKMVKPLSLRIE